MIGYILFKLRKKKEKKKRGPWKAAPRFASPHQADQ